MGADKPTHEPLYIGPIRLYKTNKLVGQLLLSLGSVGHAAHTYVTPSG